MRQQIDGLTVEPFMGAGGRWWVWRRQSDGKQVHAGLADQQLVLDHTYVRRNGVWLRKDLDLTKWAYSESYTFYRGEGQEIKGRLYWNFEPEERQTWDYPGCPAAVVDVLFLVDGRKFELTDAEEATAKEAAWLAMRAVAEARED